MHFTYWWRSGVQSQLLAHRHTQKIASQLLHKMIFQHSCPPQLLSNQGPQINGDVLQAIATQIGVEQEFLSPYHPWTNVLTKRLNKTLKQEIVAYIDPLHETYLIKSCCLSRQHISWALNGHDPHLPHESSIDVHSRLAHMDGATRGIYLEQMLPQLRQANSRNFIGTPPLIVL